MITCKCPKNYPRVEEIEFVSLPHRAGFHFLALLEMHTGRCPLTDKALSVRLKDALGGK